jgi:hypothetical protein
MLDSLLGLQNPFTQNPDFSKPENNFIERSISNGIDRGIGNIFDRLLHLGQLKTQSFAENLPQIIGIAYVSYLVYLGYKTFFKYDAKYLDKIFPTTIVYIIFKLFWKVVLHI